MNKELKAAIIGLENDGFRNSALWYRLVDELIDTFELEENQEAARFWKNRK